MKTPTQENTSTSFELIKFEKNGNNFSTLEDGPPFNRHVSGSHTRNQQNESQKLVYDDDGGREEPDVINKVPDLSKNAFVDTTTPNGTSILLDIKQEVIEDDNDADLYEVDTNGNPVATIRVPLDIWNQLILKPVKQETLDEPPPEASNVAPSASVHVPTDETPVSTVRCGLKRKNPTLASSSEVTKKTEEPVTKKVYRRNQFKAGHKLRQNQTLRHTSQKCAFCEKWVSSLLSEPSIHWLLKYEVF